MPAPKLLPVFADNIPLSARDLNAFSAAEDLINLNLDRAQMPFLTERLGDNTGQVVTRYMVRTHRYLYWRVSSIKGASNKYVVKINGVQIGGERTAGAFPGTIEHLDLNDPDLATAGKETHFQNPYSIDFVGGGGGTTGDDVEIEWVHETMRADGVLSLPHVPVPSFSNGDKVCAADLNAIADNYRWLIARDSYMPSRGIVDEKIHGPNGLTRRYNFIRNRRYLYFKFACNPVGSDRQQIDVYLHTHHAGGWYNDVNSDTTVNQIFRGDYPRSSLDQTTSVILDLRDGSTSEVYSSGGPLLPEDTDWRVDGIKKNLADMFANAVSGVPMGETYSIVVKLGDPYGGTGTAPDAGNQNWVQIWGIFETPFKRDYI